MIGSEPSRRALICGGAALAAAGVARLARSEAAALRVGSALPDPPLELMAASGPQGFDIDLMICAGSRSAYSRVIPFARRRDTERSNLRRKFG